MNQYSILEIDNARLVLSEEMLETDGNTGEPTREAAAAMVAVQSLGEYAKILREEYDLGSHTHEYNNPSV